MYCYPPERLRLSSAIAEAAESANAPEEAEEEEAESADAPEIVEEDFAEGPHPAKSAEGPHPAESAETTSSLEA